MSLNPHSPIPLYRQLAERIQDDIANGLYPVATRIPSENVLALRFEIGRPTVRQATDLLVRQGQLERRRGSGTFVLPPRHAIDLFSLAGTSNALLNSDIEARLEIVGGPVLVEGQQLNKNVKQHPAQRPGVSEPFEPAAMEAACKHADATSVGEESVECVRHIVVERRALVDGKPILFEKFQFDASVFAGLEKMALEGVSLSKLVKQTFYLEPTVSTQSFAAVAADHEWSKRLDTKAGTPLLRVLRHIHFGGYRSALSVEIMCLTENFEFSQVLYPAVTGEVFA